MPTSHTTVFLAVIIFYCRCAYFTYDSENSWCYLKTAKTLPLSKKGSDKRCTHARSTKFIINILSFVIFAFSGTPPAQEVMSARVTLRMRSPITLTSWSSEWKTVIRLLRRRWPRKKTKFLKKVKGLPSKPKLTPLPKIPLPLRVKVKVKMEQRQLRRQKSPNPGYQFYLVGEILW